MRETSRNLFDVVEWRVAQEVSYFLPVDPRGTRDFTMFTEYTFNAKRTKNNVDGKWDTVALLKHNVLKRF